MSGEFYDLERLTFMTDELFAMTVDYNDRQ